MILAQYFLLIVLSIHSVSASTVVRPIQSIYERIGCFKQNRKLLPVQLANNRDEHSKVFIGVTIDWNDIGESIRNLVDTCVERATKGNFQFIAIGFYGECFAGRDLSEYNKWINKKSSKVDGCIYAVRGQKVYSSGMLLTEHIYKLHTKTHELCSFDAGECSELRGEPQPPRWRIQSGKIPSYQTGPQQGALKTSHFMYFQPTISLSNHGVPFKNLDDYFLLTTKNANKKGLCLTFYYYIYAATSDVGLLSVNQCFKDGSEKEMWSTTNASVDVWRSEWLDVAYEPNTQYLLIKFYAKTVGTPEGHTVGKAIDQIEVYDIPCSDFGK